MISKIALTSLSCLFMNFLCIGQWEYLGDHRQARMFDNGQGFSFSEIIEDNNEDGFPDLVQGFHTTSDDWLNSEMPWSCIDHFQDYDTCMTNFLLEMRSQEVGMIMRGYYYSSWIELTIDGGTTWTPLYSTGTQGSSRLIMLNDSVSVYSGNAYTGNAWETEARIGRVEPNSHNYFSFGAGFHCNQNCPISLSEGENVFVIVQNVGDCHLFQSSDGGLSWAEKSIIPSETGRSIHFISSDLGYIGTASGAIYRTENGGADWELISSIATPILCIAHSGSDWLIIGSSEGQVFYSMDQGITWIEDSIATDEDVYRIQIRNGTDVYANTGTLPSGKFNNLNLYKSDNLVSLEEVPSNRELLLFPNPTRSELRIELPNQSRPQLINIFSLEGELIQSLPFSAEIDCSQLPNGLYLIQGLDSRGNNYSGRFVVSR